MGLGCFGFVGLGVYFWTLEFGFSSFFDFGARRLWRRSLGFESFDVLGVQNLGLETLGFRTLGLFAV